MPTHPLHITRLAAVLICCASFAFAQDAPTGGGPKVNDTLFRSADIAGMTAVTQVFGRSQNVVAVIVEFAAPVAADLVTAASFVVEDRSILSVRVTATAELDAPQADGRFVVITLDPADAASVVYAGGVDTAPQVVTRIAAPVALVGGAMVQPGEKGILATRIRNLVVDDFQQFRFADPVSGLLLDYNLYIPKDYDPARSYPLVLFLHDAGVTGSNPRRTLQQGLGAVAFASAEDQARNPAFVLAPQFPVPLANDASQTSVYVDLVPRLIDQIARTYAVDRDRLYTTGQSGGCMTSLALGISNPDLFAATFCVAGQWDAAQVAPLADDALWVLVSEDDTKAFPGMTAIMDTLQANGAAVTRGRLDAKAPAGEQARAVAAIRAQADKDSRVFFTTFTPGSVLDAGATEGGAGHVNTWVYAYAIPAIRDWLFDQRR
ncbi:MAG: hypothetical protein V4712_08945 [Pseudomonadota bacterium]